MNHFTEGLVDVIDGVAQSVRFPFDVGYQALQIISVGGSTRSRILDRTQPGFYPPGVFPQLPRRMASRSRVTGTVPDILIALEPVVLSM